MLFSCLKGETYGTKGKKEILLEKLEEMAEFTPDTYGDLQGYAVLCSAMVDYITLLHRIRKAAPTKGINWRRAENKNNSASGYGVLICEISI